VTLHDPLSDGATSETAHVRIGDQSTSLTADINHPVGSTSLVLPSAGGHSVEQVDVYDMSGTARTFYGSDTITVTADSEFSLYRDGADDVYLSQVV
jgi:hypothetical protein